MQRKYGVTAFMIILICAAPVAASTAKITSGAPVFIGESNVDISRALNGCHTIGWWQNGTGTSAPPEKNLTLYEINTQSDKIYHYNISPEVFAGYSGTWYCVDKSPVVVFRVLEPQIDIKVWDQDLNQDVSGKSVPISANITYRVDTNLYQAFNPLFRPDVTPSDSFFSVSLIDPYGQSISNIFTGSAGNAQTPILFFDKRPFIDKSPYFWKDGEDWNRSARNAYGELLYPAGTYTFLISQNLNHMKESYTNSGTLDPEGKITQKNTITFVADTKPLATLPITQPLLTTIPDTTSLPPMTATPVFTSAPIAKKTTYTPLPGWVALFGVVMAGFFILRRYR